jgi:hypothetical protein
MISNLRFNRFSELAYESDDEKYELALQKEADRKEAELKIKKQKKDEKRRQKNIEDKIKDDIEYGKQLKRTKVYSIFFCCIEAYSYISYIIEDKFNIASYLCLDSYCVQTVNTYKRINGLFSKDEYLDLVKIMELNKTDYYPVEFSKHDIMDIISKQENSVISGYGKSHRMIYEIYLALLIDTKCMRKLLTTGHFRSMMGIFREGVEEKIENNYGENTDILSEYFLKYFETGKRYIAKRNNFKVLFRNYVRFVGKIVVLYRKSIK